MKFEIGAALLHPATNRYMTTYLKTLAKSCNASIAYSEDFLLDKLAEYNTLLIGMKLLFPMVK